MKPKLLRYIPYICVFVLALLSWYFLMTRNSDVFYMQQMRSFFCDTSEFYQQFNIKPAGLLQWMGCFFTQLFYHPVLGSMVLFLMWTAIFFILKKGLNIPKAFTPLLLIPVVCLLVSEIDLGYWIYYNGNEGYCFSATIGMLIASVLILVYKVVPTNLPKIGDAICRGFLSVFFVSLYHFIGIYALFSLIVIGVIMALEKRWIFSALNVLLAIITPLICSRLYYTLRCDQMFTAGLPVFEYGNTTNTSLSVPFVIAMVSILFFTLINKIGEKIKNDKNHTIVSVLLLVFVTGGSFCMLCKADYDDENYHTECRAYCAIEECRWDDALQYIREVKGTLTRQLIIFKNIALFNTNRIGYEMYDFDDKGKIPSTRDSLHVSMANTASPLIYLHHGMANFAYRYCMEIQVGFGYNIANLRIMALSSIISQEYKLAEKYLKMLSHTMYHKSWAEHYLPLTRNPELINHYPELGKIKELWSCLDNSVTDDNGICENFIVDYFANQHNSDSSYFQELALVYSIISKDIQKFWPQYVSYLNLHKDKKIPEIYQQVAYFYAINKPDMVPDTKDVVLKFDTSVIDRYNMFNQEIIGLVNRGFSEESVGQLVKEEYGNTFWWSYFYNQNVMCY